MCEIRKKGYALFDSLFYAYILLDRSERRNIDKE